MNVDVGIGSLVVMLVFLGIVFTIGFMWGRSIEKRKQDNKNRDLSNSRVIPGNAGGSKPNPPDGVVPGDMPKGN